MCSSYRDLSTHLGGVASLVLPLSRMSCNLDAEPDRIVLGEGISFVDRESLSWAKLGHPCRVYYLSKAMLAVIGRWEFVNVRL